MASLNISRGDRQAHRKVVTSVYLVDISQDPHLTGTQIIVGELPAGCVLIDATLTVQTASDATTHTVVVALGGAILATSYSVDGVVTGGQPPVTVAQSYQLPLAPAAITQATPVAVSIIPTITGAVTQSAYNLLLTYVLPVVATGTYTNAVI